MKIPARGSLGPPQTPPCSKVNPPLTVMRRRHGRFPCDAASFAPWKTAIPNKSNGVETYKYIFDGSIDNGTDSNARKR